MQTGTRIGWLYTMNLERYQNKRSWPTLNHGHKFPWNIYFAARAFSGSASQQPFLSTAVFPKFLLFNCLLHSSSFGLEIYWYVPISKSIFEFAILLCYEDWEKSPWPYQEVDSQVPYLQAKSQLHHSCQNLETGKELRKEWWYQTSKND